MNGDNTDLIAEQTPRFLELLNNIQSETEKVSEFVSSFRSTLIDDGALQAQSEGVSLLSLKSHLLLDYVINLVKVISHRLEAKPLSLLHSDVIEQMIRERVVLEKIKPLELKTKYQIDKLVTLATTGSENIHHPLSYKPNPSNLMPREGLSLGSEGDAAGVYRPPRISAVPGIIGSAGEVREEGRDRERRRALQSSLIRDLREEVGDTPQEIAAREDSRSVRVADRRREREKYEEDNFMRVTVSKKQRRQEKSSRSEMESIMDFGRTEFSEEGELKVRGQNRPRGDRKRKTSGRAKRKKH